MTTPDQALRRFVVLSALRWLPIGLWIIVLVFLILARGHSLAAVGAIGAVHAIVLALLELPTGGLADVVGRKPVLVVASVISAGGLTLFAVADPLWQFALAAALAALGRALASGPLEAWYVDTVHASDPDADLRPGLSRGAAAGYAGLSAGALGGGLTALLISGDSGGGAVIGLSVPVLVGALVWCLHGLAVLRLVDEAPRHSQNLPDILRESRRTVGEGTRLVRHDSVLPLVLFSGALLSPAGYAVESFMPPQIQNLTGPEHAPLVYSILLTVSYAGGSLGAAAAVRAARVGGSTAHGAAGAIVLAAAGVAALALPAGLVVLAAIFVLYQLTIAAVDPLHATLLHDAVPAGVRATAVSAYSLTSQLGGAAGGFLLALLASRAGLPVGWLAASAVMALAAVPMMSRRLRSSVRVIARQA